MISKKSLLKTPSAFLPIFMSLAAFSLVFWGVFFFGAVREPDEGAGAHIWQILMGGQLPIIAYFAIRYLPEKPKEALSVLVLQFFAGLLACAPVYYFKL